MPNSPKDVFADLVGASNAKKFLKMKISSANSDTVIQAVSGITDKQKELAISLFQNLVDMVETLENKPYSSNDSSSKFWVCFRSNWLSHVPAYMVNDEDCANSLSRLKYYTHSNIPKLKDYIDQKCHPEKKSKLKKLAKGVKHLFFDPDTLKVMVAALVIVLIEYRKNKLTKQIEDEKRKEKEEAAAAAEKAQRKAEKAEAKAQRKAEKAEAKAQRKAQKQKQREKELQATFNEGVARGKILKGRERFENKEEIVIPEDIKTIKNRIFGGLQKLKKVTIPNTVTVMGNKAFNGCSALETVVIESGGLSAIGSYAFENCTKLKNITIPKTISNIDPYAFSGCSDLETVVIENGGDKAIWQGAFMNCTKLKNIEMPNQYVNRVENHAFKNCTSLERIDLSGLSSYHSLNKGAFEGCTSLKHVILPKFLENKDYFSDEMRSSIFNGCPDGIEFTYK